MPLYLPQGRTLLFAVINQSTAASNALVAAAGAGLKIKVVSYVVVVNATANLTFQSGATALTGAMPLAANGGVSAIGQPSSHLFETAANTALNLLSSAATQQSGHISYFIEA